MTQRIVHYDILSAVMILFMMHHHMCVLCSLEGEWFHTLPYKLLYFYMPYFFYKSGIFYKPDKSINEVAISSAKRLLVPFCVFTIIGYVWIGSQQLGLSIGEWKYYWWPIRQIVAIGRVEGNGPLWFLLSLFIVRIVFQCTRGNKWAQIILIVLCVIVAILGNHYSIRPRTISNVALGIVFYGLGALLREIQYNKRIGIVCTCMLLGAYIWMSIYGWHIIDFSFNTTVVGIHPLWLMNCMFACPAVVFIGQYFPRLHVLPWIGRNSITFLCVHALVYESFFFYWFDKSPINPYVELALCWVGVIVICVVMSFVFKNKYLCWMIGEKRKC